MANYTTKLKSWGSSGREFPDGYSYEEGEQPVDDWDNFITHNIISDLEHIIDLTNDRLESQVTDFNHPTSPEVGEFSYRIDGPAGSGDEELYQYDSAADSWHRLMKASGDMMTGDIDMNGYALTDTNNELDIPTRTAINGASVDNSWFSKQEGGTVSIDSYVVLGTFSVPDGESLYVTQATLTEDGFTTPCDSGVDLVIADESDEADPANASPTTVLSADGSTLYDSQSGTPLASYDNTSGSATTVTIGIDNGHYNAGASDDISVYGGYIARVA